MAVKYRIERIPVWPVTRAAFLILLVVGIIIGLFYGVLISGLGFVMGALGESGWGEGVPSIGSLGFLMMPFIAVFYAVTATIGVLIWVLIYNLVAHVVGGVELELSSGEGPEPISPLPQGPPSERSIRMRP